MASRGTSEVPGAEMRGQTGRSPFRTEGRRADYKSSTLNPVCFAIRASIFGPISTRS